MKPGRHVTALLTVVGLCLATWPPAAAASAILYVNGTGYTPGFEDGTPDHPFGTIQRAINTAPSGAEIVVAQGIYAENVNFYGKDIAVRSMDPDDAAVVAATVIDGNRAGSVVTFDHGEGPDTVLRGFVIRGGQADLGGGVFCVGSSPTIQGNVICDNRAAVQPWSGGGGLYSSGGSPTIVGNTFRLNTVEAPSPMPGSNWCEVSGGGLLLSGGQPKVLGNLVEGNRVVVPDGYAYGESTGGGIALWTLEAGAQFENNTVVGNEVTGENSYGGGVYWQASMCEPLLANCTLRDNAAASGSQALGDAWDSGTSFGFRDCSVQGGTLYLAPPSPWHTDGTLSLSAATVSGSRMISNGALAASGGPSTVSCEVEFASSTSVDVAEAGDVLLLEGGLTLAPGVTLAKTGLGALTVAATCAQDHNAEAVLAIEGGVVNLDSDAGAHGAYLSVVVADAELHVGSNQHLDALTLGDGGKVVFAGANGIMLKHLANAGTVDVTTGSLVVDYDGSSPLLAVRAMLASGRAGGTWDGPGIHSSTAAFDPDDLTAVGVLDNTDPKVGGKATFEGEAVDETAVLVKFTWGGDANLDGIVDANDYDVIDKMYLFPPVPDNMGWWTGDFTYDGAIDANDYDRIDKAYLFQTGPLEAGDGAAPVPTPEPGTLSLLALGGLALLRRRRAV